MVQTRKSDQSLINGIKNNDSSILNLIYEDNYDKIKVMVLSFNHICIDPKDIFQEGLTRAVMNIRQNKFKGESKLSTYLYSICRNICLNEYQMQSKFRLVNMELQSEDGSDQYFELIHLVLSIRNSLDEVCKQIIDLRFNLNGDQSSTRFEFISKKLGILADNARQRFRRCLKKMKRLLIENPEYKSIIE